MSTELPEIVLLRLIFRHQPSQPGNPDVNINVLTLAYDATNNELFIGGNFTTVGGLKSGESCFIQFPIKNVVILGSHGERLCE